MNELQFYRKTSHSGVILTVATCQLPTFQFGEKSRTTLCCLLNIFASLKLCLYVKETLDGNIKSNDMIICFHGHARTVLCWADLIQRSLIFGHLLVIHPPAFNSYRAP